MTNSSAAVASASAATIEKNVVQPPAGQVITAELSGNSYTIGKLIGEGAYSFVYECRDTWGNDLAAKVLKGTHTYEAVRDRAIAEYQKLVLLRHPNITYVHDVFEFRDTFYIITERCHFSLAQQLAKPGELNALWVLPVARCVLQAVSFLHLKRIAHQDIHTGNVFGAWLRDERSSQSSSALHFKLGDLGIARLFDEISATNTRADWLRPPEVLSGRDFGIVDYRVDVYHAGLLLLQVAHGRELRFTPDDILAGRPRELALRLQLPFAAALERALRRHVSSRTPDARTFWSDLSHRS